MKIFGRIMAALAALATILAIFVAACPTVLGFGADKLFWEIWGKAYWGDHASVVISVQYEDASQITRSVDVSALPVYTGEGEACAEGSEKKSRIITGNGTCEFRFTIDNTLYPTLPEGKTEIVFGMNAGEKQFMNMEISVVVREAQEEGAAPAVQVTAAGELLTRENRKGRATVEGDWGTQIIVPAFPGK